MRITRAYFRAAPCGRTMTLPLAEYRAVYSRTNLRLATPVEPTAKLCAVHPKLTGAIVSPYAVGHCQSDEPPRDSCRLDLSVRVSHCASILAQAVRNGQVSPGATYTFVVRFRCLWPVVSPAFNLAERLSYGLLDYCVRMIRSIYGSHFSRRSLHTRRLPTIVRSHIMRVKASQ